MKTAHRKSWPAIVLPVENFGLSLENKMVAIADCLKIIKML